MNEYHIYKTLEDFLLEMIRNEKIIFSDRYGRRWKYEKYSFYYADINCTFKKDTIDCLHLFGTGIKNNKTYMDDSNENN